LATHVRGFVHGDPIDGGGDVVDLYSPLDGALVARLDAALPATVDAAVTDAAAAFRAFRSSTIAKRSSLLLAAADALQADATRIGNLIVKDIGKPVRAAMFEANRAALLVRACANEIRTMRGDTLPLDAVEAGAGRMGFTRRVPYGVVAAVTPFNAPANLLLQKVAPALAAGNAVVAKPHPAGSRVAVALAEAFAKAGLPAGLFNVVLGAREPAHELAKHHLVDVVTFTGGTAAGDALVRAAGAKKFIAELGSNAANIVLRDADIGDAAKRIAGAAFEASGQQCISAQRILVAAEIQEAFLAAFVAAAGRLVVGDPNDQATDVGPMISAAAADRVMAMIDEAVSRGGRGVLAPMRSGCTVSPAIVADVPRDCALWRDEAFGPVALVQTFGDVDEALRLANDSGFGLQGAVFTNDLKSAFRFIDEFDVGSLWVNEASRFRLDSYPFGGVKRSGFGREGVRYAIEELSQLKFIGIRSGT
jgi:acyl-CoA reductase-like NAD-dependent aldehyde dehydrogenase